MHVQGVSEDSGAYAHLRDQLRRLRPGGGGGGGGRGGIKAKRRQCVLIGGFFFRLPLLQLLAVFVVQDIQLVLEIADGGDECLLRGGVVSGLDADFAFGILACLCVCFSACRRGGEEEKGEG